MTAGAVLCGGRSRRFGRDKATAQVGGVAMAERVARALAGAGCDPVVFVGGDAARLRTLGRPVVADRWPGEGPLGGVLTALGELGDSVVAACDLPQLDAPTVRRVLDAAPGDADVVVARTDGLEPMLAWWSRRAEPALAGRFAAGTRALRDALGGLAVIEVAVPAATLRNVNRPADAPAGAAAAGAPHTRSQ